MFSMSTRKTNSNSNSAAAVAHVAADLDDRRWLAVTQRDKAADGTFYYAVRTTGVYCRPSCPSRQARRENVAFYDSGAQAEQAGFRACKRCKPNEAALGERRAQAIATVCRAIEQAEDLPSLDELAQIAGMSRFHFHRVFKEKTGVTPKAYAAAQRA
ncbi:bifunctional transcriptional activator/DNA repair enzyme AdaA, partial [Herbaspirillum lusitanum]|uniref:bifunctional transcriptional activator/DNA repair enzyme AdaA n=1 Tax=Herbaspirillum lusitanum TaxID=213312 RepID=UPI000368B2CE